MGENLNLLPQDIVAVASINNDAPLMFRDTTTPNAVMRPTERTNTMIRFVANGEGNHSANYFGGILSEDRTEVYYENTSRPLPQ